MNKRGGVNPFYWALVVVGTIFAVTACAYAVMAVRRLDPLTPEEGGLVGFLADYGVTIVLVQLALLTVLTFAAIGSDDYWTGGDEPSSTEPASPTQPSRDQSGADAGAEHPPNANPHENRP